MWRNTAGNPRFAPSSSPTPSRLPGFCWGCFLVLRPQTFRGQKQRSRQPGLWERHPLQQAARDRFRPRPASYCAYSVHPPDIWRQPPFPLRLGLAFCAEEGGWGAFPEAAPHLCPPVLCSCSCSCPREAVRSTALVIAILWPPSATPAHAAGSPLSDTRREQKSWFGRMEGGEDMQYIYWRFSRLHQPWDGLLRLTRLEKAYARDPPFPHQAYLQYTFFICCIIVNTTCSLEEMHVS